MLIGTTETSSPKAIVMSPKISTDVPRSSGPSPATSSYPRTRSQTKALSPLKRKNSDKNTNKSSKPAKVARKDPSDSVPQIGNLSPEELLELSVSASPDVLATAGRTMWPAEVPRSMLFTFSANPPPFKMYDGATRTSTTSDALASVPSPRFAATGPERMFDHSWRVTFIDATHTSTQKAIAASERAKTGTLVGVDARDVGVAQVHPGHASPPSKNVPPVTLSPLRHSRQRYPDDENTPPSPPMAFPRNDVTALQIAPSFHRDGPLTPLYHSANLPQNLPVPPHISAGRHPSFPTPSESPAVSTQTSPLVDGVQDRGCEPPIYAPVPTPGSSLFLTRVAPGPVSYSVHSAPPWRMATNRPFPNQQRNSPVLPMAQAVPQSFPEASTHATSFIPSPEPFHFTPERSTLSLPPHPGGYPNMPYSIPSHHGASHPTQAPTIQYGPPPPTNAQFDAPQPSCPVPPPFYPPQAIPLSPYHGYPNGVYPVSLFPHAFACPPVVPAQPPSTPHEAPWAMFYESIKNSKKSTRAVRKYRNPTGVRSPADMGSVDGPGWESVGDGVWAKGPMETHKCPFCPRAFSLANGLAIHLKWHWGASRLDWKKGISRNGKTIERALRDADRRREEEAQRQVDQDFPQVPLAPNMPEVHGHASSNAHHASPTSTNASGHPFTMPIIAHSTFGTFDFPFASSQSSEPSPSPSTSPTEGHHPYGFPPPIVASGSTCSSHPRTPDLLPDSGSANSASTGAASPTWSENLFGCDGGDIDAEGEEDDLFGDCIPPAVGAHANVNDAPADSDPAVRPHLLRGRGRASLLNGAAFDSPRFVRPALLRAPRLGPLRLPPTFFDDDEDEDEGGDGLSHLSEGTPLRMLGSGVQDDLSPLSGLPLQSLPLSELDGFEGLSIF